MATYEQLPGRLNLTFRAGDYFSTIVDFSIGLTGYTTSAALYSCVSGSSVQSFSTAMADAAAGQVSIALTNTQTAALPIGTYEWRLHWTDAGGVARTALGGFAEVTR